MVLEDAVATLDKYDFGLINDKNSIHLPRQEWGNREKSKCFQEVQGFWSVSLGQS